MRTWIFYLLGIGAAFFALARLSFAITQARLSALISVIVLTCYSIVFFRAKWPTIITDFFVVATLSSVCKYIALVLKVWLDSTEMTEKGKRHYYTVEALNLGICGLSAAVAWYFLGF